MNDVPLPGEKTRQYSLTFLTDQWEWDVQVSAETLALAKTTARDALEAVIRDEAPRLACVYLLDSGVRIGVWDWVDRQFCWSPL